MTSSNYTPYDQNKFIIDSISPFMGNKKINLEKKTEQGKIIISTTKEGENHYILVGIFEFKPMSDQDVKIFLILNQKVINDDFLKRKDVLINIVNIIERFSLINKKKQIELTDTGKLILSIENINICSLKILSKNYKKLLSKLDKIEKKQYTKIDEEFFSLKEELQFNLMKDYENLKKRNGNNNELKFVNYIEKVSGFRKDCNKLIEELENIKERKRKGQLNSFSGIRDREIDIKIEMFQSLVDKLRLMDVEEIFK